jgi:hypothetical protein
MNVTGFVAAIVAAIATAAGFLYYVNEHADEHGCVPFGKSQVCVTPKK